MFLERRAIVTLGETALQWLYCVSHYSEFTSLNPAHECQSTSRHHDNQKRHPFPNALLWVGTTWLKTTKVRTSRYWPILNSCQIGLPELSPQTNLPMASTPINIPLEHHVFCLLYHIGCNHTTMGLNPL